MKSWSGVAVHCGALQRIAVYCSVLQCVAVGCSVVCVCVCVCIIDQYSLYLKLQQFDGAAVCCSVLKCVAVYCSVLQGFAGCCKVLQGVAGCSRVLQCVAVCCSVFQCVAAVYCSVLQHNYHQNNQRFFKCAGQGEGSKSLSDNHSYFGFCTHISYKISINCK